MPGVPALVPALYQMRDRGVVEQLSRGLYRLADLPALSNPDLDRAKVPSGVICLISALAYHEITTQIPHQVHVALPRGPEPPRLQHPPMCALWFTGKAFTEGIETRQVDGMRLRVHSPEKTLADCFKYRNKLGIDVFLEALKLYLARKRPRTVQLTKFAVMCRVERLMRPYLEALLYSP